MKIAGLYSFNQGRNYVEQYFATEWQELQHAIGKIDAATCKTKVSQEITMSGRMLYSPKALNVAFREQLAPLGWNSVRVRCQYTEAYYVDNYEPLAKSRGGAPFRDMDFVKNELGVEVQFGKYAFMVYNVCAKMTIFHNMGFIRNGIEIVPVKEFADEMSTGVSYFEQFVWDLEQRGVSNIDIPVLVVGLAA